LPHAAVEKLFHLYLYQRHRELKLLGSLTDYEHIDTLIKYDKHETYKYCV
jgi:hypothetical protein